MPGSLLGAVAATLLALAVPAQGRVWLVDSAGGGDFSDLPAAEAGAVDGDVLVVLPGIYSAFATGKGIAVLGQGSVRILGAVSFGGLVEVSGLPAGRTFSMRNVSVEHLPLSDGIVLSRNDGRIHLHDVRVAPRANTPYLDLGPALRATSCATVTVDASSLLGNGGVVATDTRLSVSSSTVAGVDARQQLGGQVSSAGAGIIAVRGSLDLSRSSVRGGNGLTVLLVSKPPGGAIVATDAALRVTGDASDSLRAGVLVGGAPLAAIHADGGMLEVDPKVVVQGSQGGPPIAGSASVVTRRIVSLTADGGRFGGLVIGEIVSPAGDLLALLLGLPADPLATPLGTVHFDPASVIGVIDGATQNGNEHFPVRFSFPDLPELRGVPVVLQAVGLHAPTSFLELSNPVVLVLDE